MSPWYQLLDVLGFGRDFFWHWTWSHVLGLEFKVFENITDSVKSETCICVHVCVCGCSLQFDPAPRRGEPHVTRHTPDYFL